jgi:transposase
LSPLCRPIRTSSGQTLRQTRDRQGAIDYSLKRRSAFTRFLDDGRLCLSNNATERALCGIARGHHNWTFAGSVVA